MDIKIETWEYELRQFIDNAIRWDISIYMKNRSNQLNYGIDHSIIVNARKHFEDFSNQLQIECDKTENDEGFEKKIKDRFLKGINRYYDFYSKNKEEIISLYTNNNGYSIMYELIKSTEREILLHYPGKKEPLKAEALHQHIFCNNGFELFEYLIPNDTDRNKNGHQRDVIYFYYRMKEDKYISIMITPFLEWYNDEYGTAITQSVTIEQAADSKGNRDRYYSYALTLFKQQK